MTTVGYGDIGVNTKMEFNITLVLMFLGVLFYSQILTELFDMISDNMQIDAVIQHKIILLKQILNEIKTPGVIRREMLRTIRGHSTQVVRM